MQRGQLKFDSTTYLQLHGKGRKERVVPLWAKTGRVLRNWFRECEGKATEVAFPSNPAVASEPIRVEVGAWLTILRRALRFISERSCRHRC
jgi:integrase